MSNSVRLYIRLQTIVLVIMLAVLWLGSQLGRFQFSVLGAALLSTVMILTSIEAPVLCYVEDTESDALPWSMRVLQIGAVLLGASLGATCFMVAWRYAVSDPFAAISWGTDEAGPGATMLNREKAWQLVKVEIGLCCSANAIYQAAIALHARRHARQVKMLNLED